jgi:crotonobetainyl-CoA:carnitine CoA-transferase CaiB-like acyl-CoA transferase
VSLPLAGVRVLDFTRAVAGPFCTMMLADLGAQVLKVEEPPAGDETRQWGPPFAGDDSTYWLGFNRNKDSLLLDLKADRARARDLALSSDVIIENFRPGVMDRLGLGYEELRTERPQLIYASVSGFGPESAQPGYDLIIQALSGLMYTSALPGAALGKTSFPVADILAALFTGQAVLAALFRRQNTGEGARIHVSLFESLLAGMSPLTSAYLLAGRDPQPAGLGLANIVPYQLFLCADGHLAVGVPNERIWERFCTALEKPEWIADERFAGNAARVRHRAELVELLTPLFLARPKKEWQQCLTAAGVPCGAVQTVAEAVDQVSLWHLEGGMPAMPNPMRISACEMPRRRPPAKPTAE